jgi:hypothetical protein
MSLRRSIPTVVATLICWLSIGLVVAVTPSGASVRDIVMVVAVLATAMLWVMWAFTSDSSGDTAASEKAKRRAGNDANAALLLELLSEDERREVRERLIERLQTDGETSSLADLLADQDAQAKHGS